MSDRKNILLIATGGTIASKKSDNGLKTTDFAGRTDAIYPAGEKYL